MATSGSTLFTQTRDQIIRRAGRQIGAWQSGEVPGADDVADFTVALNAMIKEWEADGIHVWKESEATLFLVPGQTHYTLGPNTSNRVVRSFVQLTGASAAAAGANKIAVGYGNPLLAIPMPSDMSSDLNFDEAVDDSDNIELLATLPASAQTVTAAGASVVFADAQVTVGDELGIFQTDGSIYWTQVAGFGANSSLLFNGTLPIGTLPGAVVITYPAVQTVDRPLRILDARRYDILSQQEVCLNIMSRLDYRDMPNKFTSGFPNSIFYDPQLNNGKLWVWSPQTAMPPGSLVPLAIGDLNTDFTSDMATGAVPGLPSAPTRTTLLNYTYMRSIESFLNAKDNPDFPEEWINALTWNLALEMAPEYGTPAQQLAKIERRAASSKDAVTGWDREAESIYVGVNFSSSSRG